MRTKFMALCLAVCTTTAVQADNSAGVTSVKSMHSVAETTQRFEQILAAKGMTLFTVIDHQAGAQKAGLSLRETQVVIFGNPKVGTPLMQCEQQVALDLPQKALIWEDEQGDVWFSYNEPSYLKSRHSIAGCDAVLKKVSGALAKFAQAATQ